MRSPRAAGLLIAGLVAAGALMVVLKSGGRRPASEWPEFRGPTQDGHCAAKGLPVEWGPDKNVVWKTPLPGRAWSSPVVGDGRIFLTNAINEKDDDDVQSPVSLHVLALNAADGKLLWDKEVFFIKEPYSKGFNDKNSHASGSPVYDDGCVYAQFATFGTACLDKDGNIVWKTQEPVFQTELGTGSCPLVVDDLLIFNCDGVKDPFVVALDKKTGKERWRTLRDVKTKVLNRYGLSTPLLINFQGRRQLITVGTRVVQSLDPKDGREIWRMSHGNYCPVPRPVFGDNLVFINTGFEHPSVYAIKPDGKGNVTDKKLVWETNKNVPLTPSMLVVDSDLYMVSDNGMVSCMDTQTGKVWWQERVAKTTSASPFYGDGHIYLQDELGKGYVLKPGHKLEVIATNDLGDKCLVSYSVSGNRLLIRSRHALWCIGKHD